jgi:hypothetical protein
MRKKIIASILAVTVVLILPGVSLAADGSRDASSNSMMRNGAFSTDELVSKMQDHPKSCSGSLHSVTIQQEYRTLLPDNQKDGVSKAAIKSSAMRNGTVTRSGDIIVDGKIVATGAKSFGRCDITGSTQVGHLYERATAVSFQQDRLSAFVYMPNGRFSYAIIKSCGNFVRATPKVTVVKPSASQTVAPITQTIVVNQVVQQTVTPAPTPALTKTLPATGAGLIGLLGTFAIATIGWYYIRSRKQLQAAHIQTR